MRVFIYSEPFFAINSILSPMQSAPGKFKKTSADYRPTAVAAKFNRPFVNRIESSSLTRRTSMILRLLLSTAFCLLLFSNAKADPVLVNTNAIHYVNGTGLFSDLLVTSLTLHPDIVAQQIGSGNANGFVTFASQFSGAAGTLFHADFIY